MTDAELFETLRTRLFTTAVGDVMDGLGLTRQFLPPAIRALRPDMVVAGRAMTVLEADCCGEVVGHTGERDGFELMFRALDDLRPGEVYVCTGASLSYALWGGLMSRRAHVLGAAGAVVDGFHRDTREILDLGFPVFSQGSYAQDQRLRGRVIDYRCPIAFPNGVRIDPGDIVFGDLDGVVTIPSARAEEIVRLALAKVEGEDEVRRLITEREPTGAIYARTGIM